MKIRAAGGSFGAAGGALGQQGGALGQQGAPPCYSSLRETLEIRTRLPEMREISAQCGNSYTGNLKFWANIAKKA